MLEYFKHLKGGLLKETLNLQLTNSIAGIRTEAHQPTPPWGKEMARKQLQWPMVQREGVPAQTASSVLLPETTSFLAGFCSSQVLFPQAACCARLVRSLDRTAGQLLLHPGSPALCKQTSGTIPTSPLHSDLGEFTLGLHRNLCMQLVGRKRGLVIGAQGTRWPSAS